MKTTKLSNGMNKVMNATKKSASYVGEKSLIGSAMGFRMAKMMIEKCEEVAFDKAVMVRSNRLKITPEQAAEELAMQVVNNVDNRIASIKSMLSKKSTHETKIA